MKKVNAYIEIVKSSNPGGNAMSGGSRSALYAALSNTYSHVAITVVNDLADLEALVERKPDLVVAGIKKFDNPRVWLSSYLKKHGINFIGSDAEALTLQLNKQHAKQTVIDAGLQSSRYFISPIAEPSYAHDLRFPLFVKPANRGGSKGVDEQSVVYSQAELTSKIFSIHNDHNSDALVEEYLPGREFSVAVVYRPPGDTTQGSGNAEGLWAMPIEITSPADKQGNSFLSQAVKKADAERVSTIDDHELKAKVNGLAINVFKALGSRDYGRIDMRLDANGEPNFIEANLMPGLSNHGYLSRCFMLNDNIGYDDMVVSLVDVGLKRLDGRLIVE